MFINMHKTAFLKMQRIGISAIFMFLLASCMETPEPTQSDNGGGAANTSAADGFISGYWSEVEVLASESETTTDNPQLTSQKLEVADDGFRGALYLSWTKSTATGDKLNLMTNTSSGSYAWSDPDNTMFQAFDPATVSASMAGFSTNRDAPAGYAIWDNGSGLNVREFHGAMNHFMGSPFALPSANDEHAPHFVPVGDGAVLITQTHMMNGFGLSAFERTAYNQYLEPDPATQQVHRMGDAASPMAMAHDALIAITDGNDNVRAIWVETQGADTRLMTAVYEVALPLDDATTGSWGPATAILDSAGDTHGVNLSEIHSMNASGEHGNNNIHLALFLEGAESAIYTIDFNGSAWGHPMRRDMGGMAMISGEPDYAVYHSAHLIGWIQHDMSTGQHAMKSLRFSGGAWGAVETIASAAAIAEPSMLSVSVNHEGHAVATWVETASEGMVIASAVQMSGESWSEKEIVTALAPDTTLHQPKVVLRNAYQPDTASGDHGLASIVWTIETIDADSTIFNTYSSQRIHGVQESGGSGDPGTGPGAIDYMSGYWNDASQLNMAHMDPATNPDILYQKLEIVDTDTVFLSWSEASSTGEVLRVMRGINNGTAYDWTDPASTMMQPAGITASATMTQFVANTGVEGYALWDDAGILKISEFMEMSGTPHFMGTAEFGEGHAARILTDGTAVYLVTQSHMMNGFGLDVYTRNGFDSWTGPVQLHRMGMDAANAIAMGHDDLVTIVDGAHNIRAIWKETQAGETRLMTAVFDTTTSTWGTADAILDTAGMTHGVELASIASFNASGEHGNANVHVAMFVDTADDEAIYTMDFDGTADTWNMPTRQDGDTGMFLSNVEYTVYHATHMLSWVEDEMGMTHIKSLTFTAADGWGTPQVIAMASMGSTVANLDIALNHNGDALAAWTESDTSAKRILNAVKPVAGAWAMKELVANYPAGAMLSNIETALHEDGTAWIVWNVQGDMSGETMFTTLLSTRVVGVATNTAAGSDPGTFVPGDGGTGGGDTGGGGTGGGDTGGGGTGGGDTGGGTGVVDYAPDYWTVADTQYTSEHYMPMDNASVKHKLEIVNNTTTTVMDTVFYSWSQVTADGEVLMVKRGTSNGSGYDWTSDLQPMGISAAATMTQFVANNSLEGFALWDDGGTLEVSEFMEMGGTPHFMHTSAFGEGHAARILTYGDAVYLVSQGHMMNGFGLNVFSRVPPASLVDTPVWSDAAVLHRMGDAASPMAMGHDDLVTLIDGAGNIRAIWKETQGSDTRLMSAVYTPNADPGLAGTWSTAEIILNSASDPAPAFDPAAITSFSASGEHGNSNIQLAMFVDTADDEAIWTMDYHEGMDMWHGPVRQDLMPGMTTLSDATYAVYHASHLVSWVENHMGETHIKSMLYSIDATTGTGSWSTPENVAMPATDATIGNLNVALNHHNDLVVAWTESDADGVRILNAVKPEGGVWAMKELIANLAVDVVVSNVEPVMHDNGVPWIAWTEQTEPMTGMIMFTNQLSQRTSDVSVSTPVGGDTGGGGTGGGDTGGGGTGGDTGGGGTGGDTGGGGTGGDTGGSDPGTDPNVVDALWDAADTAASSEIASSSEAEVSSLKLQTTTSGTLYTSWLMLSDPDPATFEFTNSNPFMSLGTPDGSGGYNWTDPNNTNFQPEGYNPAAMDAQFFPNPYMSAMGIATWNYNNTTNTSEFMNMGTDENIAAHFMGSAVVDEGHATQVLYDSTGQAYLINQTHMTHGFALSVYERGANANTWLAPVELVQTGIDAADAYNLVDHFLIATVDGQDNIRAVWLEEHANTVLLQTATFNTSTNSWGTISTIDTTGITLGELSSGIANGRSGTADLQVILHQQSGMMGENNAVFAVGYTEAGDWTQPIQLDEPTATSTMAMAPAYAVNDAGDIYVAWVERDSSMGSTSSSGQVNKVMAKHYMPGMGWHGVEYISDAWTAADVTALIVVVNASGQATATWIETYSTGSNIVSSHKIGMTTNWSQKELVQTVLNADGNVTNLDVVIDSANVAITAWVLYSTDGINDTFQVMRSARSTAIDDAVPGTGSGSGGGDTGGGGTGGGDTGGGGSGTTDPGAGGNDIPVNTNWTTPVLASQMMHTTNSFRIYGPQVVMDDVGGTAIRVAMKNRSYSDGVSIRTVNNHVLRSVDNSSWYDILMGSGVMDDLSSSAVVETIKAIPTLGNLYALIRDGDTLYLAQYDPDFSSWDKKEVAGVSARLTRRNMQLTTSLNGMVTLVWHERNEEDGGIDINAMHLMGMDSDWGAVETLNATNVSKVITPHSVAANGTVQVTWLVAGSSGTTFDLKMATYTPMMSGGTGWSAVMDGPTGLSGNVESISSGANKVVVTARNSTDAEGGTGGNDQIDAYVLHNSGSWSELFDINGAQAGIDIINRHKIKVVAGGDNHFMVAWRERINVGESYTYRYRTALIHYMENTSTGMMMWHNNDPSEVGGSTSDYEQNLDFVLDAAGNAYAVWTGVDTSTNTENVYVNHAMMDDPWMTEPDLLASYDLSTGNYAGRVSIANNSDGGVGIAWDQHMSSGSMSMHNVWSVENQLP